MCDIWMAAKITEVGGPASFQRKLLSGFRARGISVGFGPNGYSSECRAALVINGTRHLGTLLEAKRRGARILQRLGSPFSSSKHQAVPAIRRVRTWIGDQLMISTRRYIADRIVYQSCFVRESWEREYGLVKRPSAVIYNGVDLSMFSPDGSKYEPSADICMISVEGTQLSPHQSPAFLAAKEIRSRGKDLELLVFGNPWADAGTAYAQYPFVKFMGLVANEQLPFYYRGASAYVLNDIVNAGCPNSVIEALACGCAVVGYSPGVLPEILSKDAGICVHAQGDPWKGEPPGNVNGLVDAAIEVVENNSEFRQGARRLAEERYDLDHMVDQYMDVLFG
jgi:glycosyltransferase involved in cell wall biosynthesis